MPDLYALGEYPDLYVDACCINSTDDCLFISLWGRDTAIQELLARLSLPISQNGLNALHVMEGNASYRACFRDIERFDKRTTRAFQKTRFGSLVQVWLFDLRCTCPDRVNLDAVLLTEHDTFSDALQKRLWQRVKDLCPLPLLDQWQFEVITWLNEQQAIQPAKTILGRLSAWEISLDQNAMAEHLGHLIREGILTTEP